MGIPAINSANGEPEDFNHEKYSEKQQFVAFMLLVIWSMIGRMEGTRNG